MLGPGTTAGKIDDYETRFTMVNGAHFLIAGTGDEAWPISAAEAEEYKAHYRRQMVRARWLRRGLILTPILIIVLNAFFPLPRTAFVRSTVGVGTALLLVFGIPLGFLLHNIVSDLARTGIERRLKHRITTRLPEAVTPKLTAAGRAGRRLLFACLALEIGMAALHLILGRDAFAQHMRIMYRMGNGQEEALARLTGNLAWVLLFAMMLAILLMIVDRRGRRRMAAAEKAAKAATARDDAREQLLRQLADERRAAPADRLGAALPPAPRVAAGLARRVKWRFPGTIRRGC
jgi:hypothetical protein